MRPKKVILLVDGNQDRHTQRRFVLETRGYRVLSAGAVLAVGHLLEWSPDLVAISDTVSSAEEAIRAVRNHPCAPKVLLLLDRPGAHAGAENVDASLPWASVHTAWVLDRIRTLVARKRGPKQRRVVVPIPAAAAHRSVA